MVFDCMTAHPYKHYFTGSEAVWRGKSLGIFELTFGKEKPHHFGRVILVWGM
jgi:hypothetical protein